MAGRGVLGVDAISRCSYFLCMFWWGRGKGCSVRGISDGRTPMPSYNSQSTTPHKHHHRRNSFFSI